MASSLVSESASMLMLFESTKYWSSCSLSGAVMELILMAEMLTCLFESVSVIVGTVGAGKVLRLAAGDTSLLIPMHQSTI